MIRRHWPLALWYACHFAAVGLLLPYLAPWLRSGGHSSVQIGTVFAILGLTSIVAPNLWGWLCDHTGRRLELIRLATALAALSFLLAANLDAFWALALGLALFGCFRNAALPQFEALTFEHLGDERHLYGAIRLWGSVGFIIAVTVAGGWLEARGMHHFPWLMTGMLAAICIASLLVEQPPGSGEHGDGGSVRRIMARPEAWGLLLVSFLQQASHGPFYAFFSIHLADLGYRESVIGLLWALGVLAEIVIFVLTPRLLRRYSADRLIMVALGLTVLRWLATGWLAREAWMIMSAQLLHAASFGVFHAAAIDRIHRLFTGDARGRGQALYSSLSFGAGVAAGSFLAGLAWDPFGAGWTFTGAAVVAMAALGVAGWLGSRHGESPPGPS